VLIALIGSGITAAIARKPDRRNGGNPPPFRLMLDSCSKGMGRSTFRVASGSPHRTGSGRTLASP
jgi:hypothetical protein